MVRYFLSLVVLGLSLFITSQAMAADYKDGDIHKNDYKWFQFNLLQSVDNKLPFGNKHDTFFELEFGGRSGLFEVYGFLDVQDILDSKDSSLHKGDNLFFKFTPRMSLDALTGHDLAIGPFKEWYIASLINVGDRALFDKYIGLGADVEVPWFGKIVTKLMARYVRENFGAANEGKWDGYIWTATWFKPFHEFSNKSYVTYQGFIDYTFAADKLSDSKDRASSSVAWYNGLYWHSERYAAGYGLKYYKDMALLRDGGFGGNTTGLGHYFVVTYKF